MFKVGLNKRHGGNKGVGLESDKDECGETKDDLLSKKFMMSVLVTVSISYGDFGIGTVIDWTVSHDGLGKILEELEEEPDAHGKDVVCGFESDAGNCAAFDVDGEGKVDLSKVGALPACKLYAGADKIWIIEFKMSVLLISANGVGDINGVDPDESGERFGVEDMAGAWTLDEQELGLAEESQGGDIVCGFKTGVRCSVEVESDVDNKHGWDEPCLWLRKEHENTLS